MIILCYTLLNKYKSTIFDINFIYKNECRQLKSK